MTAHPKPKVVKDPEWLKVVRQMPCYFRLKGHCNEYATIGKGPSEVSHLDGKSRDDRCVPSCGGHHRTNSISWHNGEKTFCDAYVWGGKEQLIREAEDLYKSWKEGR